MQWMDNLKDRIYQLLNINFKFFKLFNILLHCIGNLGRIYLFILHFLFGFKKGVVGIWVKNYEGIERAHWGWWSLRIVPHNSITHSPIPAINLLHFSPSDLNLILLFL